MIETRSINQDNLVFAMLDIKVHHSRRARVHIRGIANFGQSFVGRLVDELVLALNTVFLRKWKTYCAFTRSYFSH